MNIIEFVGLFIIIAPDATVTNQIFFNILIFLVIYIKTKYTPFKFLTYAAYLPKCIVVFLTKLKKLRIIPEIPPKKRQKILYTRVQSKLLEFT